MQEKKVELAKILYADGSLFVPTDKEKMVVAETIDLFRQTQSGRDRNFQYFDGLNLFDYIDDSVRRFNTNVDEREGIEDWQAGVHVHFTRNKVLGFLGKIIEALPVASFVGRGDEDNQKATILSNIYEFIDEQDDYDEFMSHLLLETIVKGTGIGYEDIDVQTMMYRDVEGVGDDIRVKETKEDVTKIYSSIVPLEEFYPSSVSIRKIKDMPYCFWRKVIPYSVFKSSFGFYKKSELVQPKQTHYEENGRPYYMDYIDSTVPDGSVELIRFYDKLNDQYIILANGIWLNPIKTKDGEGSKEEISPLPWNHKDLPFWEVKFDFFGDFFYGKSLPDRLKSMQDVLNVLTNMLLDQSFLTIFPPLLTNGFDDIEDDYIRPGRRTPVDTQGLPINQAFQVLDMKTPSGWHQYILDYTRQVMEESSLDKVSSGIAGQGDRTTAQEIRVAASGVASMLGIFARMVNYGIKRRAGLKGSNILQFGFNEHAPILRQIMGEDSSETAKKAFSVIKIDNAVLTNGKRGTKIIELYSKENLPQRADIQARALVSQIDTDKEVEIVAVPPGYVRNFKFDVKVAINPKSETSIEMEKALEVEKVRTFMEFFPDLVNRQELAAQLAEKFGDDPTKILSDQALGLAPAPEELPQSQINTANNMQRSAMGGQPVMP